MKHFVNGLVESLPLSIFLIYIQCVEIRLSQDWLLPYLLATVAALGATGYLLWRGVILNRLSLGINVYFLTGLLGLVCQWQWLNHGYGQLRALAMLGWILVIGLVACLYSRHGFIGVRSADQALLKIKSWLLLAVAVLALAMASYFFNNRFWGEWCPFIVLFLVRGLLQHASGESLNARSVMGKIRNKIAG